MCFKILKAVFIKRLFGFSYGINHFISKEPPQVSFLFREGNLAFSDEGFDFRSDPGLITGMNFDNFGGEVGLNSRIDCGIECISVTLRARGTQNFLPRVIGYLSPKFMYARFE